MADFVAIGNLTYLLLLLKPRQAIKQLRNDRLLRSNTPGKKLHIGCGVQQKQGFINIDLSPRVAPDYIADVGAIPCRPATAGRIESYHVIEHIPHPKLQAVLEHWHSLLEPNGIIVAECPDFLAAAKEYVEGNKARAFNIFGWQRYTGDTHYFGFDADTLREAFESAGFLVTSVGPGTDYHADAEPCLRIEAKRPS